MPHQTPRQAPAVSKSRRTLMVLRHFEFSANAQPVSCEYLHMKASRVVSPTAKTPR